MIRPPDTKAVLTKSVDIMNEKGWAQGVYSTKDGAVCAYEAIVKACDALYGPRFYLTPSEADRWQKARQRASEALAEAAGLNQPQASMYELINGVALNINNVYGHTEGMIIDWNDDDHTTKEDVVLAFKKAAESYE